MARPTSTTERAQLCGPDCQYRGLYAGAQASLADMAARQAGALQRLGRLRAGVVTVLRSALPRQFAELEHRIAGRVSDVNDETLLSYAAYLLETSATDGRMSGGAAGMEALRSALRDAGFSVPDGFDLAAWASAVSASANRVDGPRSPVAENPIPEPVDTDARPASTQRAGERRALPVSSAARPDGAVEPAPPATAAPQNPQVASDTKVGPAGGHDTQPGGAAPAATSHTGWQPRRSRTLRSVAEQKRLLEPEYPSPLGDWMGGTAAPAQTTPSGPAATPVSADVTRPTPAAPEASRAGPAGEASPETPESPQAAAAHDQGAPDPQPEVSAAPQPEPAPQPAKPQKTVRTQTVRPELFPGVPGAGGTRTGKRGRRTVRTQAIPPDPQPLPGPNGTATELNDETRAQLSAAIALPRPVFTSDLESLVASPEVLDEWQTECRADPDAPIRFIPGKRRHRARGSLVLPQGFLRNAAVEFKRSWWAEAMTVHTGSRLYELAVLLRTVGEQVVSHRVHQHEQTVLLRLAQPRGLVGVVVVLAGDLEEAGKTRGALVDDIEELMSDRLELLVVLSTTDPNYQPMVDAIAAEATERGWEPGCHVVAARSWEYADGNTGALKQVIG